MTTPFRSLLVDGAVGQPQAGDRLVYDERNGTLFVHRDDADVRFVPHEGPVTARLFLGRAWSRDLNHASAELYARMGGLSGSVEYVEGSFPSL